MKKNLHLTIVCLFTISFSYAQFEVGQKVFSGGISLSSSKSTSIVTSNQSNFGFGLYSTLGKFVTPNHLVGFGINFSSNSQQQEVQPNLYKNNFNQIGFSYFSAYYKPLVKNLYGYITWGASGNYNFNSYHTTVSSVESVQKTNGFSVGISATPGIAYKLNKRVLINVALNNLLLASFTSNKSTYSNSAQVDKYNGFGLYSSLNNNNLGNISIGFNILLHKK